MNALTNDLNLTERLIRFIEDHGHTVKISPSDPSILLCSCEAVSRDGSVTIVTDPVKANLQSVRDWLGY